MYLRGKLVPLFLLLLTVLISCSKKKAPAIPPALDPHATLVVTTPSDSFNITRSGTLQISGKITGDLSDYSFMEICLLKDDVKDTLEKANVEANGDFSFTWKNTLDPGVYGFRILPVNPYREDGNINSVFIHGFVCIPKGFAITDLIKDDTSITVSWEKASASNFKEYRVFVTRTDTEDVRPPYPPGKLIASITDINTTSYKDKDIYLYYKYDYLVKTITTEDCEASTEPRGIEAGTSLNFDAPILVKGVFDATRNRFYGLSTDLNKITSMDPETFQTDKSADVPGEIVFADLGANNDQLNIVRKLNKNDFQLLTIDINSFTLNSAVTDFSLPDHSGIVQGVFGNVIVYSGFSNTTPAYRILYTHNISNATTTPLLQTSETQVSSIRNNGAFVVTNNNDSFFVYNVQAGAAQFETKGKGAGINNSPARPAFDVTGYIIIGGSLYDPALNLLYSLPAGGGIQPHFIGAGEDGKYVVSSTNEIFTTSNMQVVKKYGDGFGGVVYFSADDKTLYHLTGTALGANWHPPLRLFRFPWM